MRGLATHVVDSILVTKPVGTLDLERDEVTEMSGRTAGLTVSYMCHRQSSSVMFYASLSITPHILPPKSRDLHRAQH